MSALTTRIDEINNKLQQLSTTSQSTAPNVAEVTVFLEKLSSGQVISGLNYLTQGLNSLSTALRSLGVSDSEIRGVTSSLLNLSLAQRQFATESNQLYSGRGGGFTANYQQNLSSISAQVARMRYASSPDLSRDQLRRIEEYQQMLAGQQVPGISLTRPQTQIAPQNILNYGRTQGGAAGEQQVDIPNIKNLGLGAREAENLNKRLGELGFTYAKFGKVTEEASSGIRTVSFAAEGAGGSVRTYTAHISKAGEILDDTQRRFRTFGSAILRNILEVTKWTIAIGLVYGPMRKLQQLIEESKKLQSDLVDTQITLGDSTKSLASIFQSAADIADQTSSSIEGVIEGYNEALAATGGMENESKRLVTTQTLLKDSMILSKLAGIDQSQALDTLVGALRQAGMGLDQGQKLLDGWVAVSKKANVSLNQLASTFAIVGTAAQDVGMSTDELNAIVGTLAEATKLSADETGNAIRGFISGFQSVKAEEILARYGIAVRNLEGDVRSFTDIMRELAVLKQEGVLTDKDVAAISNVVGGGFRRGAQFAALLQNYNRVLQLTEVSQNAAGDSATALDLKMSTLESAITRLNNSFSRLAMSLGTSGGTLSGMTLLTEGATKLVTVLRTLIDVLGVAAPLLATMALGKLAAGTGTGRGLLSNQIPKQLASAFFTPTGFRGGINTVEKTITGGAVTSQPITYAGFFDQLNTKLSTAIGGALSKIPFTSGTKIGQVGLGGAAGSLVLAGTQAAQGNYEKAGASLAGSFVGAMVGGGTGAIVGGVIAQGFYDTFLNVAPGIAERWAQLISDAQKPPPGAPPEQKSITDMDKEITSNLNILEKMAINIREVGLKAGNYINPSRVPKLTEHDIITAMYDIQKRGGAKNAGEVAIGGILGGGNNLLSEGTMKRMGELQDEFFVQRAESLINLTTDEGGLVKKTKEVSQMAGDAASQMVEDAIKDISLNKAGAVQQFTTAPTMVSALSLSAAKLIQATTSADPKYKIPVPSPKEAVDIVSSASSEQLVALTQLTDTLIIKREELRVISGRPLMSQEDIDKARALSDEIETTTDNLSRLLPAIQKSTLIKSAETKIIPVFDVPDKVPPDQIPKVLANAKALWIDYLKKLGLTDDEVQAFIEVQQEKILRAMGQITDIKTKVPQEFFTQATEQMGIGGGAASQWSFTDLRDKVGGQGQVGIEQLLSRYSQISTAFKENVPGFQLETSPQTLILKDGFKTLDLDMRLFNLAMQDLIDIEKEKTMEGMFNLPSGSTFYVPFEAAALDARSRANDSGNYLQSSMFDKYIEDPNAFGKTPEVKISTKDMAAAMGINTKTIGTPGTTTTSTPPKGFAMTPIGYITAASKDRIENYVPTPEKDQKIGNTTQGLLGELNVVPDLLKSFMSSDVFSGILEGQGFKDWWKKLQTPTPSGEEQQQNIKDWASQLMPDGIKTWWDKSKDKPLLPQEQTDAFSQGLDKISEFMTRMWESLTGQKIGEVPSTGVADTSGLSAELNKLTNTLSKGSISTSLQLDINSQTSLMVDGRVLATIIKPYLYEDLLRFEGSAGSIAKVVTIS